MGSKGYVRLLLLLAILMPLPGWALDIHGRSSTQILSYVIKGLPSAGGSTTYVTISGMIATGTPVRVPNTSSTLVPNNSAAVHNYKYIIELLQDSITNLGGTLPGAVRPSTSADRPATSYNPSGINQPYPSLQ